MWHQDQCKIDGLEPIKSHYQKIIWSCKIRQQPKIIIYSLPQCLWLPNVVFHKLTQPFWLLKVTWSIRSVTSLLQKGLWAPNLGMWWPTKRSLYPQSYITRWIRDHVRPRNKLKAYLNYRNAYGYQTWLVWYMQWGFSLHQVRRSFDSMVLLGHITT